MYKLPNLLFNVDNFLLVIPEFIGILSAESQCVSYSFDASDSF